VDQQRQHYKKLKDGKSASITPERIAMLEEIEFVWNAQDALFRKRLEELREFVDANGFGRVPPVKTHCTLSKWLQRQRQYYLKMKEGEKVSLTQERVSELQKLGFLID
jgi:Helicase associated domain